MASNIKSPIAEFGTVQGREADEAGLLLSGVSDGAPSGGAGKVLPGCLITDATNGALYTNTGTTASPTWTLVDTGATPVLTLTNGHVYVGNASNHAADVAMSGDATIANTGALTIANNAITTAKIADANVTLAKLESVTDGNIIVGNASNVPAQVAMSGDVTIVNSGATTIAAGAVDSGKIAAGGVALANLAAGITPSHIVVFAGTVTWSGGAATLAHTVTGLVGATDLVIASIKTVPTESAYLAAAAGTDNTITFTLSTANTSNDAVITYQVLRAAA